ncbi:MAG: protein adenylyltransferase SelO [Pseudomonadota bacterium]
MRPLEDLDFDNSFARLPEPFYSRVMPTPVPAPELLSYNETAAALLDLDPREAQRPEFVEYFSGNRPLPGSEPLAALYAGHQFGHYVPQLGDGRAILLGEVRNRAGERWELQLKGAGRTPYSRGGDGRAVLRSTIREYLCSEAMHGLGIPSTRALCIVGSELEVYRESVERGAVLLRLAPSHVRFGSFEVFFYRDQHAELKLLADYVIERHYPELADGDDRYVRFFQEVVLRTARLLAQWQAVGFAHGVMNTDNMSILGLTLDYGPFGFLDRYDPGFICNHSDHAGRYAFDRQPQIGLWNLTALAQALSPLVPVEAAREALGRYGPAYATHYVELMCAKLGLRDHTREDIPLVTDLLQLLHASQVDYTGFFRALGGFSTETAAANAPLRDLFIDRVAFDAWAARYRTRLLADGSPDGERKARMARVNPKYVLRNYLAQIAIDRAVEARDYSEIDRLLALLRRPYDEQPDMQAYAAPPPDWAQHIQVSCSS